MMSLSPHTDDPREPSHSRSKPVVVEWSADRDPIGSNFGGPCGERLQQLTPANLAALASFARFRLAKVGLNQLAGEDVVQTRCSRFFEDRNRHQKAGTRGQLIWRTRSGSLTISRASLDPWWRRNGAAGGSNGCKGSTSRHWSIISRICRQDRWQSAIGFRVPRSSHQLFRDLTSGLPTGSSTSSELGLTRGSKAMTSRCWAVIGDVGQNYASWPRRC